MELQACLRGAVSNDMAGQTDGLSDFSRDRITGVTQLADGSAWPLFNCGSHGAIIIEGR